MQVWVIVARHQEYPKGTGLGKGIAIRRKQKPMGDNWTD